jgi:CO/xanthine dehydrogenase FAD-binding subunit
LTAALAPRRLDEALAALAADPALVPIAGCTDLLVTEAAATERPAAVLDLLRVEELRGVREAGDGSVEIGATTTFAELQRVPAIVERFPALAAAAATVGAWQIQNRATLGGNIVHASPAGDSLPVLLALDAKLVCASAAGRREVSADEFFVSYRKTALVPGELLVAVLLPAPAPGAVQRFRKVGTREAQAISKVVVALTARVEDGTIVEARIAAGSVAATPVRLRAAEAALAGRPPDTATADAAGRAAAAEVTPIDDVRSTAEYRRFALERVVRRLVLSLTAS